jgi:hypothetical protein
MTEQRGYFLVHNQRRKELKGKKLQVFLKVDHAPVSPVTSIVRACNSTSAAGSNTLSNTFSTLISRRRPQIVWGTVGDVVGQQRGGVKRADREACHEAI